MSVVGDDVKDPTQHWLHGNLNVFFLGKPLFGSQKVIFPSFGSQNKIFPSFYQSHYNFSFIRLTKVNFSTILSIFCQFFHHSIKVFFFTFSRKYFHWKKFLGRIFCPFL